MLQSRKLTKIEAGGEKNQQRVAGFESNRVQIRIL